MEKIKFVAECNNGVYVEGFCTWRYFFKNVKLLCDCDGSGAKIYCINNGEKQFVRTCGKWSD